MSFFIDLPINDKGKTDNRARDDDDNDDDNAIVVINSRSAKANRPATKLNPLFAKAVATPTATEVASLEQENQRKMLLALMSKMLPKTKKFEKASAPTTPLLSQYTVSQNAFLATIHEAFANEKPLVLSPDHIWSLVAQAVSIHVNENAEALRGKFVQHTGKQNIIVDNDQLRQGVPESPWEQVFPEFLKALDKSVIGGSKDLVSTFSTTGNVEGISSIITFMDTVKAYFSFTVRTRCGIPRITLLGTKQDWVKLRNMAEKLLTRVEMVDLWWAQLAPILDKFIALSNGENDIEFWSRIYNSHAAQGSGESNSVSGWILDLFPYSVHFNQKFTLREGKRLTVDEFPSSLNTTPFVWDYFGTKINMSFVGGAIGVGVCSDGQSVTPSMFWAVVYKE